MILSCCKNVNIEQTWSMGVNVSPKKQEIPILINQEYLMLQIKWDSFTGTDNINNKKLLAPNEMFKKIPNIRSPLNTLRNLFSLFHKQNVFK